MQSKIICVGFEKTGTTSLGIALKLLGYSVKENCPRALIPILKGNYNKVFRIINDFDAMADKPWFMIYKELDKKIPGSKFILTIRDSDSWYRSVSRHFSVIRTVQHEWIYGRGKGLPKENQENALKIYTEHNQGVVDYFADRPQDLLVIDLSKGDQWNKLCTFLNKETPKVAFPHSNKSASDENYNNGFRMKLTLYRRTLRNNLLIKYIDWRGYW